MNDEDTENGSPPDPSGGSSSAPDETINAEVVGDKSVPVITPALVYDLKGKVVDLPVDKIKVVDDFLVPNGNRRAGGRERSFSTC